MSEILPANRPAARPNGGGYTHRTWLDEMADGLGHVAGIYRMLETMDATLHEVRAGRTQRDLVAGCRTTAFGVMARGVSLVKKTDERYAAVFEAIQRAGGQDEVAKDKRYHDQA